MKRFSFIQFLFVAVSIFLVSSCETLPDDTPVSIPPSVDLLADAGFIATDATISGGEVINVRVRGSKGDASLSSLEMLIDGARFTDPASDIEINGAAASSSAPVLFDADKEGFTWDIAIKPHSSGTATYSFVLSDDAGETSSTFVDITVESAPLMVEVTNGTAFTLPSDTYQPVDFTVTRGSSPINTLTVYEDGVIIADLNRLKIGELVNNLCFAANPLVIDGDDKEGFSMEMKLRSHLTEGAVTYKVEAADDDGNTAFVDVVLTVENPGTPIDAEFTQRLLQNADGPNATGGLDLSTGNTISVNDTDADIIDSGIDGDLPADQNWIQTIEPANGASLRRVDSNQPELFDYDAITTKEEIIAAYDAGVEIAQSAIVQVGDVFMVLSGGDHFILKTTKVEITAANNEDFYEFSVKQALQ